MKGARIWEGKDGRNERKEGRKEGRREGRKEGRKEGRQEARKVEQVWMMEERK